MFFVHFGNPEAQLQVGGRRHALADRQILAVLVDLVNVRGQIAERLRVHAATLSVDQHTARYARFAICVKCHVCQNWPLDLTHNMHLVGSGSIQTH